MPQVNPEFRKFFMESLTKIALENGQSLESIEKDGPLGLELLSSLETFELMCQAEDEFGVDLSAAQDARTVDDLVERVSDQL